MMENDDKGGGANHYWKSAGVLAVAVIVVAILGGTITELRGDDTVGKLDLARDATNVATDYGMAIKLRLLDSAEECLTVEAGLATTTECKYAQSFVYNNGKLKVSDALCLNLALMQASACDLVEDILLSEDSVLSSGVFCLVGDADTSADLVAANCGDTTSFVKIAPLEVGTFRIRHNNTNTCLNSEMKFELCSISSGNQLWVIPNDRLKTKTGGLCVSIDTDGSAKTGLDCSDQVLVNQFGRIASSSGHCMRVDEGRARFEQGENCHQQFDTQTLLIETADFLIRNSHDECLVPGAPGDQPLVETCTNVTQRWTFDGQRVSATGFCLTLLGDATRVSTELCDGAEASGQSAVVKNNNLIRVSRRNLCIDHNLSPSSACEVTSFFAEEFPVCQGSGCCTATSPCGLGAGTCSSDLDCTSGLTCSTPCILFDNSSSASDLCCDRAEPTCSVSTAAELEEQLVSCPTGRIKLTSDIAWSGKALSIDAGRTVKLIGARNGNEDESVALVVQLEGAPLLDVSGNLALYNLHVVGGDIYVQGGVDVTGSVNEDVQASVQIDDCKLTKSTIFVQEGAAVRLYDGKVFSGGEKLISSCEKCEVIIHGTTLSSTGTEPLIEGTGRIQLSSVQVLTRTPVVSNSVTSGLVLVDSKNTYTASYCASFVELSNFDLSESPGLSDCMRRCDKDDLCLSARWADPDPVRSNFSHAVCHHFSEVSECESTQASRQFLADVFMVSDRSISNEFTSVQACSSVEFMTIPDVASKQECRGWFKMYPDAKAMQLIGTDCMLMSDVGVDSNNCALQVEVVNAAGYEQVAEGCSSVAITRTLPKAGAEACGTFCSLAGLECAGVAVNGNTCSLLAELPANCDGTGDNDIYVSSEALAAKFPKLSMTRASGLCPTSVPLFTWTKIYERSGCTTLLDFGRVAIDDLWADGLGQHGYGALRYDVNGVPAAYYKRSTNVSDDFSLYDNLVGTWSSLNNSQGLDFDIFSNERDMVKHINAWSFCNFDAPGIGFPRDCSPSSCEAGPAPASEKFCIETGATVAFYALEAPLGSSNLKDCEKACENSPRCTAVALAAADGSVCTFHDSNFLETCDEGNKVALTSKLLSVGFDYDVNPTDVRMGVPFVSVKNLAACQVRAFLANPNGRFTYENHTCSVEDQQGTTTASEDSDILVFSDISFNATFQGNVELTSGVAPFGFVGDFKVGFEECKFLSTHVAGSFVWAYAGSTCSLWHDANIDDSLDSRGITYYLSTTPLEFGAGPSSSRLDFIEDIAATACVLETNVIDVMQAQALVECETLCNGRRGCTALAFSQGTGSCQALSSAPVCDTPDNRTTIYFAVSQFELEPLPLQDQCFAGKVLGRAEDVSLESCKSLCVEQPVLCGGITYNFASATCETHVGSALESCDASTVVGRYINVAKYIDEEYSFFHVPNVCPAEPLNGVLEEIKNITLPRCERRCELTATCRAVVYDMKELICKLQDGGRYVPCESSSATFHLLYMADKYSEMTSRCASETSVIETVQGVSSAACAATCEGLSQCRGLSFADNTCTFHADTNTELLQDENATCTHGPFYTPHSDRYYTQDDGRCSASVLDQFQVPHDICSALCDARFDDCRGFNFDAPNLSCQLVGDTSNEECSKFDQSCGSCNGTLNVAYRQSVKSEFMYEFVSGKICHDGTVPENLAGRKEGSLEHCKRLCATTYGCRAVSMTSGVCKFSAGFSSGTLCPDVFLKLRVDRFGRLLNVLRGSVVKKTILDKRPVECTALCQARGDCINVAVPCVEGNGTADLECELLEARDTSRDNDDDLDIRECNDTLRDVYVHEVRQMFTVEKEKLCTGAPNFTITGEFSVVNDELCKDLCHAMEDDCVGVEYEQVPGGLALATRADINCVTYYAVNATTTLYNDADCSDVVTGSFFPRVRGPGTLDAFTLATRLWLRTPNGRVGRNTLRKVKAMQQVMESKLKTFALASVAFDATSLAISGPLETVSSINDSSSGVSRDLLAIKVGLKLLGPMVGGVPYVGKVLKVAAVKVGDTFGTSANRVRKVGSSSHTGMKALEKCDEGIAKVGGILGSVAGVLATVPVGMLLATNLVISAHKCAFEEGSLTVVDSLEQVMDAIQIIAAAIADVLNSIRDIGLSHLAAIELLIGRIIPKLSLASDILGDLSGLVVYFAWLRVIVEFKVCVDLGFFGNFCVSLKDIVDIINTLLGFLEFLLGPFIGLVEGIIPDVSLPFPSLDASLFDELSLLAELLDKVYEDLVTALKEPFKYIEELMEQLTGMIPEGLGECEMGPAFETSLLGEAEDDEDVVDGETQRRLQTETTTEDAFTALVHNNQKLKVAIQRAFIGKKKEDTTEKKTRNGKKKKNSKEVIGDPKPIKPMARTISIAPGPFLRDILDFRISTSVRVSPIPATQSYLATRYDLTSETGVKSEGPVCYMKINPKTGDPLPLVAVPRTMATSSKGALSADIFDLEFNPGGSPFEELWNFELEGQVVAKLPSGLRTDCPACPQGAKCKAAGVSARVIEVGAWETLLNNFDGESSTQVYVFPPMEYRHIFFRHETSGLCLLPYFPITWLCQVFGDERPLSTKYQNEVNKLLECYDATVADPPEDLKCDDDPCVVVVCNSKSQYGGFSSAADKKKYEKWFFNIEHIFDKKRKREADDDDEDAGHDIENVYSRANLVYSWSGWNNEVSRKGKKWKEIKNEKSEVYGDLFKEVENTLKWCTTYRTEHGGWRTELTKKKKKSAINKLFRKFNKACGAVFSRSDRRDLINSETRQVYELECGKDRENKDSWLGSWITLNRDDDNFVKHLSKSWDQRGEDCFQGYRPGQGG